MAKQLARELINAGVHFGHGVSRWNPKMAPFIFAKRGNIHVIDVKETLKGILIAKKLLAEIVSSGSDVVFVGTKRQAQKAVEAAANRCGMHFVSERWLGGMLTNFRTIRSRLQRLEQLEAMEQDGTMESESKKQASRFKREMRKIRTNLDGVRKMTRLPGAVVVVDARKEYLALREARKLNIPTVGVLDTDSDPDTVDVAIPANDDSIRADRDHPQRAGRRGGHRQDDGFGPAAGNDTPAAQGPLPASRAGQGQWGGSSRRRHGGRGSGRRRGDAGGPGGYLRAGARAAPCRHVAAQASTSLWKQT